jgi:thioredoxin-like negative regulator of GroEL
MRIRALIILASLLIAVPLFANETKIYSSYETVRQALLKNSVADVQKSAKSLAAAARSEKQEAIAVQAETLAEANDVVAARRVFAALSEQVIKFRAAGSRARPSVAYCSMEKKSWLQPAGSPISNPYLDGGMRTCGQFVKAH